MARKNVTTSINADLAKKLRFLAVELEKPLNELFEEAIQDLLNKYENKGKVSHEK